MATAPKLNTIYHEGGRPFQVIAPFAPTGDQPQAIEQLAAGIAAGVYTDYKQAAQRMVKISKRIEPNPENHKIYRRKFEKYKKIVQALASLYY